MQGDVAEEGMDGSEAHVATAGAVAAFTLKMIEERAQQRRVEFRHGENRGCPLQALLGEPKEQAKGVAVACDRVRTRLPLAHEAIREERLQQGRQCTDGVHGRAPCFERSTLSRA